jgi:hypothetical protein
MNRRRGGGGGHATAGGVDFQALIAAAMTVGMLAETEYEPPWHWPRTDTIEAVRAETGEETDDIWVLTATGGRGFVQAKTSVSLSATESSEFGKSIRQFVDQYIAGRDRVDGRAPLDRRRDRLVLAIGPATGAPVRVHLASVLDRLNTWPADRPIKDASANAGEARALSILTDHITKRFKEAAGAAPTDVEMRDLLALITVSSYAFGDDGYSEREALGTLRTSVVLDTGRAGDGWNALCRAAVRAAAGQAGLDRRAAQEILRREGISLRAPRSYREDIDALVRRTDTTMASLEGLSAIALRAGKAKIVRDTPRELERLAGLASCLVVGDPGAGKSATLYDLGHRFRQGGADVIALTADQLDAGSLGLLRVELNLQRDLVEILANWPTDNGVLIVDALDAARGDRTQDALLDLIEQTLRDAPDWTVVASIRRFDLRYNKRLQRLFPVQATPAAEFLDPEFARITHLNVALLSEGELAQLERLAPDVHNFLAVATPDLQDLVRVPFNLRLLAELVDAHVDPTELHPICTQLELLDIYWEHRVLTPVDRADIRESLLRRVCDLIISSRTMHVNRADLQSDAALAPVLREVLSAQVLVESGSGAGTVDRSLVSYAHHVLFDYAGARLLLRLPAAEVVDQLGANPDLPLLIRPSLDLHMQWLWEQDPEHHDFWELAFAIAGRPEIPEIATLAGTTIAASMTTTLDDLTPLIEAVTSADPNRQELGERVLAHVLAGVQTIGIPLAGEGAAPWSQLVALLSAS